MALWAKPNRIGMVHNLAETASGQGEAKTAGSAPFGRGRLLRIDILISPQIETIFQIGGRVGHSGP